MYVSSDSKEILELAESIGAIPILRGKELCGDTPNIPVYQDALRHMGDVDGIIAVQANSPTISISIIGLVKRIMGMGIDEVMTCHEGYSIYGSVWALSSFRLKNYPEEDIYHPKPNVLIVDKSVDIHTLEDYKLALKQK